MSGCWLCSLFEISLPWKTLWYFLFTILTKSWCFKSHLLLIALLSIPYDGHEEVMTIDGDPGLGISYHSERIIDRQRSRCINESKNSRPALLFNGGEQGKGISLYTNRH
jgi:hypothetical protein